jgi:hypothetical protein
MTFYEWQIWLAGATLLVTLAVACIALITGLINGIVSFRQNKELQRVRLCLDQSLGLLERARDAAMAMHEAETYLLEFVQADPESPTHQYITARARYSANWAELQGLAQAIGDDRLTALVQGLGGSRHGGTGPSIGWSREALHEHSQRGVFGRTHARIAELLEQAMKRRAR